MNTEAINMACEILGSQRNLAILLGITPGAVNQWCTGRKDVPLDKAIMIEGATNNEVTVEQLRPGTDLSRVRNGTEKPPLPVQHPFMATHVKGMYLKSHKAHGLVKLAIKYGYLPKPSTLTCQDCGQPAQVYDHRDYNRPLDVEPVCHACNIKRGPALPFVHVNDR